ncbi:MAG TPA: OmpH family outer membrane protein [Bacteroidia bacterium]|jgi:outer membrane protein|nr:OmpH family outer membrane protein [Bacteroidia bacterium]
MKNIFRSILATGLILAFTAQTNAQKIGHIHLDSLLVLMPETKKADADAQDHYKQLEQRLQNMQGEYQKKLEEYQKEQTNPTSSQLIKTAMENDLQRMQQGLQEFQQNAQADFQNKKNELLKPIYDKANKAIADVAKAGGYKYVFDTSSGLVVYYEASDNLMPAVRTKLNIPANAVPFNANAPQNGDGSRPGNTGKTPPPSPKK